MDAVLRDEASGFRHWEVIEFIKHEVALNGSGPNFYRAHRSRSWKEVEDKLLCILSNPRKSVCFKRANAWNALALSVRLGVRQLNEDEHQIQWLSGQVNQRVAASKAMSAELMWLREQQSRLKVGEMHTTRCDLKKVLDELDILLKQLCHLESTNPALAGPSPHAPPPGALMCQSRAQLLQDIEQTDRLMPLPVPQPFPLWGQFQRALPSSRVLSSKASKSEIENGATSGEKATSHPDVYSPGHWPGAGTQKKMALPHSQRFPQGQYPKKSQAEGFKKEFKSRDQEKIPMNTKSEARSHFLTDLDVSQVAANLEKMQCRSDNEYPRMSQEKGSQKKYSAADVRKKSMMQIKTRRYAEYKYQDTHASTSPPKDWRCLSCNALNFRWKTFCCGCFKRFATLEKECLVQYTQRYRGGTRTFYRTRSEDQKKPV